MKIEKIYVYAIYFPTSNKYYIGQTDDLNRRMVYGHLNSDNFVGRALRKYDDWQISILHTCKSRDIANRTEIEEIRNFNSIAPNGYNLCAGGGGLNGYKRSEKFIKNHIERMQGNQFAKGKNLGNKYTQGKHWKNSATAERNRENNPMQNPKNILKSRITTLKNKITNLEKEKYNG